MPVAELIPDIDINIEMMLRDKPAEGLEWIKSATTKIKQ